MPGVRPLLRAGRHQPHVARGLRPGGQRAGERDERPDARRVVVGPGGGRDAVGVRHRDHQAVARRVPDPDHVARRPLAGHVEALVADAQPDRPEARRHPLMRRPLGRRAAGRGPCRASDTAKLWASAADGGAAARQDSSTPRSAGNTARGYPDLPHMISTNQFKNGNHIEVEGTVFKIIEFQHVKPGKGGAFVRTKLRRTATAT